MCRRCGAVSPNIIAETAAGKPMFHDADRDEKNRRALRPFSIVVVAAVLLMQTPYAHAQHMSAPAGPSEKEKAKAQEKRAFEKDTDEAYKSTLSKIPDAKQQKVDPWGSMRTAPK
ncbi:MAG: hypothetical protein WA322_25625 [Pseudolabrys sp.]